MFIAAKVNKKIPIIFFLILLFVRHKLLLLLFIYPNYCVQRSAMRRIPISWKRSQLIHAENVWWNKMNSCHGPWLVARIRDNFALQTLGSRHAFHYYFLPNNNCENKKTTTTRAANTKWLISLANGECCGEKNAATRLRWWYNLPIKQSNRTFMWIMSFSSSDRGQFDPIHLLNQHVVSS